MDYFSRNYLWRTFERDLYRKGKATGMIGWMMGCFSVEDKRWKDGNLERMTPRKEEGTSENRKNKKMLCLYILHFG